MTPRPAKTRSRLRRLCTGLCISTATVLLLLLVFELVARIWLVPEILSFRPVYRVDDIGGYRFQPGLSEYLFGATVKTNSLGRRGPEWSRQKPAGAFRVALIGDSLAFGFGVEFEDTCGEVLARMLAQESGRRCEVLNFALPGYNSDQELEVLQRESFAFAPDAVLVIACSNDHEPRLWVDADGYPHWGEPGEEGTRIDCVNQSPRIERWGVLRHLATLTWIKQMWTRYKDGQIARSAGPGQWMAPITPGPPPEALRKGVLEPLVAMSEACRQRDIPMVLAVFSGTPDYRLCTQAFAQATGRPTLEIPALFPEIKSWYQMVEQCGLSWDSHPHAAAYLRWARGIADLFFAQGLLKKE